MKKRMLCCLLALVLAVGLLSACGSVKAAVYVQSVAALTGYGSLGGANASAGIVVAQKEIKVERDSSRKVKQLNVGVGQEVKTGEVLFTYDMEDMQLTGAGTEHLSAALSGLFTPLSAVSFLTFTLLYTPCVAAIAAIGRELGGRLRGAVVAVFQCVVAWCVAAGLYQLLLLIA